MMTPSQSAADGESDRQSFYNQEKKHEVAR
jgi:hypothetical protein